MHSTRRGFLRSSLVGAGATAIGAVAFAPDAQAAASVPAARGVVPFYGSHQAGIATPTQNYLQFAAFDVLGDSLASLRKLLRIWSDAAAAMSVGRRVGPVQTGKRPPVDTGEAIGLGPSDLTVTFGFGGSLFSTNGKDRFGLAKHKPKPLVDLPAFKTDALQADICGGDIGVQVCANDPQVAFHAVHDLIKLAHPIAAPRWLLAGFGRTGNTTHAAMPRNLMGFQDGTANIMAEDTAALNKFVWAKKPASPAWMVGGSYLVARRIQLALGRWDRTSLDGQQQTIGREKISGAVLASLPAHSHILLASPTFNNGERILRRGYSYLDGIDQATGTPAAGFMFLCYQADPRRQFIPIQAGLAVSDALSAFVTHIGSAVFACPPGAKAGEFVGQGLVG
jgi:deferrochelatase/peroxidase EfeB